MINRRRFLYSVPAGMALLKYPLWSQSPAPCQLTIHPEEKIAPVPDDMMGLSYESTELGDPDFFSARNTALISRIRQLSPRGVLRIGGNTSEFTYFRADAHTPVPPYHPLPTQPPALTAITPEAIQNLRKFLEATGWDCIYGLNLGNGTPARAAEEAAAVYQILGPRLKYVQVGNEPNNYIRYQLRPDTWNAAAYFEEWLPYAKAILARIPQAKLGGPDMGAERDWVQLFASRAVPALGSSFVELTDHFYAEGPPSSPDATIEKLLHNTKIHKEIAVMQEAGQGFSRPYRMTEVNSCYSGGKPGVSDTFASALWAGDLTLRLMSAGFSGINFHGGNARHIKASLGGSMPGDHISRGAAKDSYYTPIAGDVVSGFNARPVFYGMALAARFSGGQLLRVTGATEDFNAYAVSKNGGLELALFNLSMQAIPLHLDAGARYHAAKVYGISAPFQESTSVSETNKDLNALDFTLPPATAMHLTLHG